MMHTSFFIKNLLEHVTLSAAKNLRLCAKKCAMVYQASS